MLPCPGSSRAPVTASVSRRRRGESTASDRLHSPRRTVAWIRPCGSVVAMKISRSFGWPNGDRSASQWWRFGSVIVTSATSGMALDDRPADDPDRVLDRRALVLGEDVEQRPPDALERRVEVRSGAAVPPGRGELRRHDPIVGVGQRRVLVAREPGERRLRRSSSASGRRSRRRRRPRRAWRSRRPSASTTGRGRTRPGASPIGRHACSSIETVARSTCGDRDEVARRAPLPNASIGPVRCSPGERVDRVLHRVGRDDERVVAVDVRAREVALERDRDGQVANGVAVRRRGRS